MAAAISVRSEFSIGDQPPIYKEHRMGNPTPTTITHMTTTTTQRAADWMVFAAAVAAHIETYTVPQYGDKGQDQATEYSTGDLLLQVRKYVNRFGRNQRPGQNALDLLKIAHYVQMTWDKVEK
jgi:hypothetical protein